MCAINVTNDLLLIYNSNSYDSSNLCAYYLAHRPKIAGANVLGVACDVGEFTTSTNCDAQIVLPILNWLTNNPAKRPQYVVLFYDIPTRLTNFSNGTDYANYGSVNYHLHILRPDWQPFVNNINAKSLADCMAYVDKIAAFGSNYSPGKLVIGASAGGYGNTNYVLDGIRNGGPTIPPFFPYENYSGAGYVVANATNALLAAGVPPSAIFFYDGLVISNNPASAPPPATGLTNVAGYICWGVHSSLGGDYPNNGAVQWKGNSGWWIIETVESFNGQRNSGHGSYEKWFSPNAFGGTNYSNTPIGAVTHVEEPFLAFVEDSSKYFAPWAVGKNFAICAWNSRQTPYFQVVGDPFVIK